MLVGVNSGLTSGPSPNSLATGKNTGNVLILGARNYGPIVHIALVSRDWLVQRPWNEQGIFGEYQAMPVPDNKLEPI